ncbi:MAG TPA: hypothetical protein VLU47_09985 [Blastocatellia bacterium]|nr:hypothetical protein [Blastocatellia bacterium]
MSTIAVPTITAMEAQAIAFQFLNDRLPDRVIPDTPRLDVVGQVWRVPVVLSYPNLGVLGTVGEIIVSASASEVISSTPVEDIRSAALALAETHREALSIPIVHSLDKNRAAI